MTHQDVAGIRAVVALIEAEETASHADLRYRSTHDRAALTDRMDAIQDGDLVRAEMALARATDRVRRLAHDGRVPVTAWIAAETAVRDGDIDGARDLVRWVGRSMARQGGAS